MAGRAGLRYAGFAALWMLSVLVIALGGVLGAVVPAVLGLSMSWSIVGALVVGALAIALCARVLTSLVEIKGPTALLASGLAGILAEALDVGLATLAFGGE